MNNIIYAITNNYGFLSNKLTKSGKPTFRRKYKNAWMTADRDEAYCMNRLLEANGYVNPNGFGEGILEVHNTDGLFDDILSQKKTLNMSIR